MKRGSNDMFVVMLKPVMRSSSRIGEAPVTNTRAMAPVSVDTSSSRVTVDGFNVKLTAQEFRLLAYLMHHQGKVVSRTELTEHIYRNNFV